MPVATLAPNGQAYQLSPDATLQQKNEFWAVLFERAGMAGAELPAGTPSTGNAPSGGGVVATYNPAVLDSQQKSLAKQGLIDFANIFNSHDDPFLSPQVQASHFVEALSQDASTLSGDVVRTISPRGPNDATPSGQPGEGWASGRPVYKLPYSPVGGDPGSGTGGGGTGGGGSTSGTSGGGTTPATTPAATPASDPVSRLIDLIASQYAGAGGGGSVGGGVVALPTGLDTSGVAVPAQTSKGAIVVVIVVVVGAIWYFKSHHKKAA